MIRPGTEADVPVIRSFDEFSNFRLEEVKEGRLLVCERDGQVVGYISLANYRFYGFPLIVFLCVSPKCRRSGIASELLSHVESKFDNQRIFTSTEDWNEPMRQLLAKRGYLFSGSLTGVNKDGAAEVFYYKDTPPAN